MAEGGGRVGFSWLEFNDWARQIREKTGKRPGVCAIREWWFVNAERVWPEASVRPTYDDAKRHAKGLRSKAAIRAYFRDYRARRKSKPGSRGKPGSRKKMKSGERACSSDEDGDELQPDPRGEEPELHSGCSDDEERRDAAATLVMTLPNQPQRPRPRRARRTPIRFRSGAPTESEEASSSYSSGDVGDDVEDAGSESDGHASSDSDPLIDGKAKLTRSSIEPATGPRELQQQDQQQGQQPSGLSAQGNATARPLFTKRQGSAARQASARAAVAPRLVAAGADADNPVGLLQFLATAGGPQLQPGRAQQSAIEAVRPGLMHLLVPPQSATLQRSRYLTNAEQGLASASAAGQSAYLQQGAAPQNLPEPEANALPVERGFGRYTQPVGVPAAQALPSSLLQRRALAPLSSAQCVNVFGYEAVVDVDHMRACATQLGAETVRSVAGLITGVRMPALQRPAGFPGGDGPALRETPNALKRVGPASGYQPPNKKAVGIDIGEPSARAGFSDPPMGPVDPPSSHKSSSRTPNLLGSRALMRTAAEPASARRESAGLSGLANARTPLPQRQGPGTGHIPTRSPNDATDAAGAEPNSILRLGSIGSAFKAFVAPELGLDSTRQDAEDVNWGAGVTAAAAAAAAGAAEAAAMAAVDGLAGGGRNTETAGELVDGVVLNGGAIARPQANPASVLFHVQQQPDHAGPGQVWVPVDDPFGNAHGSMHYGNGYVTAYANAASYLAVGAVPPEPLYPGLPYLVHPPPAQQQGPVYVVPPAGFQHLAYPAHPPATGNTWHSMILPGAYQPWQLMDASGRLYAGMQLPMEYAAQGEYAAHGGYAAEGGHDAHGGYAAVGGYEAYGRYEAYGGYEAHGGYAAEGGHGTYGGSTAEGGNTTYGGYAAEAGYGTYGGYVVKNEYGLQPTGALRDQQYSVKAEFDALSGFTGGLPPAGAVRDQQKSASGLHR
ncbi:hypothetical protein PLESTB_000591500 [Pleodorina starrii]|uniref:Uncharacterized protein n=1 Tax=Pleodorina starrii TaxID=330485 RepID=A0A9W6BI08_9CHLO|nr:hypothetical protein PLESTM_000764800 [Pleodorina starrii]GLC52175.1 hypothetical protein PLESTB_000591500 [Pleodorina starrii]GLC75806.1 hypothetical protein PLESTF_001689600 [Pleodorina starrii]